MKRLSAILIVMILLIAVPIETFAVSKPAQVKNLKASAKTSVSITMKWSKAKGAKGYEVQQYNTKAKKWKALKKVSALNYKNTKLKANTVYKYRVRAYTSYKQYYNTKTKKWVNKKPAANAWKTKKSRTVYVYGKVSSVLTVRTSKEERMQDSISVTSSNGKEIVSGTFTAGKHAAFNVSTKSDRTPSVQVANPSVARVEGNTLYALSPGQTTVTFYLPVAGAWNGATKSINITVKAAPTPSCTHEWNEGVITTPPTATSTGVKTYTCTKCGATKTETIPKSNPYDLPYESWIGCADDGFAIDDIIFTTDYLNREHKLQKYSTNCWKDKTYGGSFAITNASQFAVVNKNVDAEWTRAGSIPMLTYHGATFNLDEIANPIYAHGFSGNTCELEIYNCDASKISIESDATIENMATFDANKNPINRAYYVKNGHYIAEPYPDGSIFKTTKSGGTTTCAIRVETTAALAGDALGIYTDVINYTLKYDGKTIGTFSVDTTKTGATMSWSVSTCNGMSPVRKAAYDIALTAVAQNGGKKDFDTDMRAIVKYINNNYSASQHIYYNDDYVFDMSCIGGVLVLETYAVKEYGEYGFITHEGGGAEHKSFRINSDPTNPNRLYMAGTS